MKNLYTQAPVKEVISIALRSLNARGDKPEIPMQRLLELAVTKVHFNCNESWYYQKDGLAIGASLSVISAKLWIKSWELQLNIQTTKCKTSEQRSNCRNCEHRVTAHSRRVECKIRNR